MVSEFVTAQVLGIGYLAAMDGTAYICRNVYRVVDFVKFLVSFDPNRFSTIRTRFLGAALGETFRRGQF